ncbi:MAG: hypothetical protein IJE25_03275 [Clostridia bacterium]|nr:hypothetical protein [Clostridia bacterium]
MKKLVAMLLALTLVFAFVSCGENEENAPKVDPNKKSEGVMTYAEYMAADVGSEVVIEAFVQAKQGWWDDKAVFYLQDGNGGYFAYDIPCTKEAYDTFTIGSKVKVTGPKAEFKGEVEIYDNKARTSTIELVPGDKWIAPAFDVTSLMDKDNYIDHQNKKVAFKGLTVVASNEDGAAFLYNWDGSGVEGSDSDLYFNAEIGGKTYTFVIEYYLTGADSDAYKAVQALKVGDVIDLEGFLYWYDGAQPHITSVKVK